MKIRRKTCLDEIDGFVGKNKSEMHHLSVMVVERAYRRYDFNLTEKDINEIASVLTELTAVDVADFLVRNASRLERRSWGRGQASRWTSKSASQAQRSIGTSTEMRMCASCTT